MKNVLLTTTALVAFAGAAVAADVEFTYTGEATVEYNVDTNEFQGGAEFGIDLMISQELNNGAVASLSLPVAYEWEVTELYSEDYIDNLDIEWLAKIEASYGSISFGPGVVDVNNGAFSVVAGMDVFADAGDSDDFSDDYEGEELVFGFASDWWWDDHEVRAETSVYGWTIMASADQHGDTFAANATGSMGGIDLGVYVEGNGFDSQMGVTASGSTGALSYALAYASGSWGPSSMGIGIGYDVSDTISVSASHAINDPADDQTAVGVAYDDGAITASADYDVDAEVLDLAAGYAMEVQAGMTVSVGVRMEDVTGTSDTFFGADVAYVMGDLALYAGYDSEDEDVYAGASYDLGGGASAYAYYSDNLAGDASDLGPVEWSQGTVVGLTVSF